MHCTYIKITLDYCLVSHAFYIVGCVIILRRSVWLTNVGTKQTWHAVRNII